MVYTENIFTRIVSKSTTANVLFEDEEIICIKDIKPQATTHFLVLPKKNVTDIVDFLNTSNNETVIKFFRSLEMFIKKTGIKNFRIVVNKGSYAEIHHLHIHIISDETSQL